MSVELGVLGAIVGIGILLIILILVMNDDETKEMEYKANESVLNSKSESFYTNGSEFVRGSSFGLPKRILDDILGYFKITKKVNGAPILTNYWKDLYNKYLNELKTLKFDLSGNWIEDLKIIDQKYYSLIACSLNDNIIIQNVSERIYIYWEEVLYHITYNETSSDYLIILLDGGYTEINKDEYNDYGKLISINNLKEKAHIHKSLFKPDEKRDEFIMNIINSLNIKFPETIAISTKKNSITSVKIKESVPSIFNDVENIQVHYYELSKTDEMINDLDKAFEQWEDNKK